jgi:malonyl-CoA/methylmalonyl-CoA synthetase
MTSCSNSPTRQLHSSGGGNFFHRLTRDWHMHLDKDLFILPGQSAMHYSIALDRTQRLATVLVSLGIERGDRVAVQVDKSPMAVLLYLACLQVGAVYLPLNTSYTETEVLYFLGDATPKLFVLSPNSKFDLNHIAAGCRHETLGINGEGTLTRTLLSAQPMLVVEDMSGDDLAAILYTSGTTGRSKGAMITHGNLASNCCALIDCWQFEHQDVLIHALPIFHIHGLFVACNMVLASTASMIFLPSFNAQAILDYMPEASVLMGVPTFYTRLLQHPELTYEHCQHIRLFVSGSAPLAVDTHKQFLQRTGKKVLERYGMTETGMITSNPYENERRPGSVGFSLPGVQVRIVDRDKGTAVSMGEVGSIEVRGPNVCKGYWRMPEKTAEEFQDDGYFVTGDLGNFDVDGYLNIVGRDKDLVISGGYNIYPKEVEIQIDAIQGVIESAVVGLPHHDFGEAVTALVVLEQNCQLQDADIKSHIKPVLAGYKRPKKIIFVDALPRNSMGKVMKNELRNIYQRLYSEI